MSTAGTVGKRLTICQTRLGGPAKAPSSGNPENPIKDEAVINGFGSVRGADGENETLKERPFLVRHNVSCKVGLHRRFQLESCPTLEENLFFNTT